jgi:hypothetical protein
MSMNASAHDDSLVPSYETIDALKYPSNVRAAIIIASSAALWALLIAGGWGLWSLIT